MIFQFSQFLTSTRKKFSNENENLTSQSDLDLALIRTHVSLLIYTALKEQRINQHLFHRLLVLVNLAEMIRVIFHKFFFKFYFTRGSSNYIFLLDHIVHTRVPFEITTWLILFKSGEGENVQVFRVGPLVRKT